MSTDCVHIVGLLNNGLEVWPVYSPPSDDERKWLDSEDDWYGFCPLCGIKLSKEKSDGNG